MLSLILFLIDMSHNISTQMNENCGDCPGINDPSYYVAGHNSFTDIHSEDTNFDSANLILGGLPDSMKLWLIIDKDSINYLATYYLKINNGNNI
ncbi:hypothetical protein TSAR_014555 [Trichomalopsis sarcophagae]|uniref:Uncharacterized protein n=1 Tax=Trichomalopsis sarcophagae TaxID=543379 RepID=A0A232F8B5_9HYME|nr:hypothetical protein TSAR_014555 [Trichomalopsis sarcophagae]